MVGPRMGGHLPGPRPGSPCGAPVNASVARGAVLTPPAGPLPRQLDERDWVVSWVQTRGCDPGQRYYSIPTSYDSALLYADLLRKRPGYVAITVEGALPKPRR